MENDISPQKLFPIPLDASEIEFLISEFDKMPHGQIKELANLVMNQLQNPYYTIMHQRMRGVISTMYSRIDPEETDSLTESGFLLMLEYRFVEFLFQLYITIPGQHSYFPLKRIRAMTSMDSEKVSEWVNYLLNGERTATGDATPETPAKTSADEAAVPAAPTETPVAKALPTMDQTLTPGTEKFNSVEEARTAIAKSGSTNRTKRIGAKPVAGPIGPAINKITRKKPNATTVKAIAESRKMQKPKATKTAK